jgi:hypothetical protein
MALQKEQLGHGRGTRQLKKKAAARLRASAKRDSARRARRLPIEETPTKLAMYGFAS